MSDETTAIEPPAPAGVPRSTWRRLRRVLTGAGIALGTLVVAGVLLYSFGTMQPPSAEARVEYEAQVAAGLAPAVPARFGIPVPGCVCHGEDPALQMQHSTRRIGECRGCHVRS